MKYSLLDNAVDSLKATYNSLEALEGLLEGKEHHTKDAILSLNHANELLFKLLLKQNKEYLMFSDIGAYMNAKEKMKTQKKSNVFEVAPRLHTIGFNEAIRRLELLCDIEVPSKLKKSLFYLNGKRNELMHFEIEINPGEAKALTEKLQTCYELTVNFFSQYEPRLIDEIEEARFELTDWQAELYGHDPDVEAMNDEAYIDWLMEEDNGDLGEEKQ
ncbi:hypothetical protein [Priestia megaterium]|uniref:hypothetical protein n=1 Tax=Priestia megaterium TaxID=1404 RepID=UPI001A950B43|nr:hypothetical protein [Priestia megaterium]QSX23921.1 hypothetical protein J0P05_29845 [Priestia megaterium]